MRLTCLLHSTLFYLLILSFTKCRANFEKQIDLENHIASAHEGRKQYTCNKSYRFNSKRALKKNRETNVSMVFLCQNKTEYLRNPMEPQGA